LTHEKPLLNLDEEPHNADWLRLLARQHGTDADETVTDAEGNPLPAFPISSEDDSNG